MVARSGSRRLLTLLVIGLVVTLTVTSPAGALSVRDPNFNGVWQDWGGGWQYCYATAGDIAWWRYNGINRFQYQYTPQQWWDCDKFSTYHSLGASGVADTWIGDGNWHSVNNGWMYKYYDLNGADAGTWQYNGLHRFYYDYTLGQWSDHSSSNGASYWSLLGGANVGSTFVGDGNWHSVNNGWMYEYYNLNGADGGTWRYNALHRFYYDYTLGQWSDHSSSNGANWWSLLGGANVGSTFVGDGIWHDVNNGGWKYEYYNLNGYDGGTWQYNGLHRFYYDYALGQWYDHSSSNVTWWSTVGGASVSSAFIGDSGWHNLNNGWAYIYGMGVDQGSWVYNGRLRLVYSYALGQWYDPTTPTWSALGIAGLSSAFLGDGTWHDLKNGWSWLYTASGDHSQWMNGTNLRFDYFYIPGQWYDYSPTTSTWSTLGAGNVASTFIGDGTWHGLNDGWSYMFTSATDTGEWKFGANSRFRFAYTPGQWSDFATNPGVWSTLGTAGLSATFLGDGAVHDVYNNGSWIFSYNSAQDKGYWQDQTVQRFAFDYLNGQWFDTGAYDTGWTQLGAAGVASQFIGDGSWHTLNNGWQFIYATGVGRWQDGFGERFKYDFASGQWSDLDANIVWNTLGIAGIKSQFIGDGTQYDLGLGAGWMYSYAANNGSYVFGAATRFSYDYGTGAWTDYAPTGAYQLGANLRSGTFIGNGLSHDLGNGWFYTYLADEGYWSRTSGGPSRLSYLYTAGQWFDWDKFSNKFALGASGALASSFMGDEAWHDVTLPLGNAWWYQYNALNDEDRWAKTNGGPIKFAYGYAAGDWYDIAPIGGTYLLGSGMTAAFIGDEAVHDLLNNWRYAYGYTADEGYWSTLLTGQTRLSYNYGAGQWYQHYGVNRYELGGANTAGQFIGDGNVYDLGVWPGVSGNWWYQYSQATDVGSWSRGQLAPVRFTYAYGPGQWSGGNAAGFFALGNAGLSPVFIGDGAAHDITTGVNPWWYTYTYASDTGSWSKSDIAPYRFAYDYTNSQWTDNAPIGGAYLLGNAGLSASFIGDGTAHALNATWKYTYNYSANEATWLKTALALNIYSYNYDAGQWYHYDSATPYALGNSGQIASSFIGDGAWHDVTLPLGNTWWYKFDGTQVGQFAQTTGGTARFGYDYVSRLWRTYGFGGSALQLGNLKLDTWVGDGLAHNMGTGWQFTYNYGTGGNDQALFTNAGYVTQFAYDYVPGQWNHSYNSIFSALGNAGNAISNSYYDGGIYSITIGTLAEKYQFVKGNIGGAADREVGYYYGATGTAAVGPNMAYSYYANGAADGSWALIQKSGTAYVTFTEAGLTPSAVNFADGAYHTTFTGQWARAKFDPTGYGKVYFELSSQNAAIAKEEIYYDRNLDQWYDKWNYNNTWVAMTGGFWYGSQKFMATNLASGRTFSFNETAGSYPLTMYFGDSVTSATWANIPAELVDHILMSARSFYDYTTYNWWNGPPNAWYHQTNPGPIVSPGNYYVR
jgi:hypothetical protein